MSYREYDDLYEKAQQKGKYRMFSFDMVNSKRIGVNRKYIQLLTIKAILNVYNRLKCLEEQLNRKILHTNDNFFSFDDIPSSGQMISYFMEPFNMGDQFGFTIINNSIESELVYKIWQEEKEKVGLKVKFHYADVLYETDNYEQGNELYFRGYCISKVEEVSKQKKKTF